MEKTEFAQIVGNNIKKYRVQNGLTQEDFSELAGISLSFCAAIETARKTPSAYTLRTMADRLHVTVDYFVYCEPNDTNISSVSKQLSDKDPNFIEFIERFIFLCDKFLPHRNNDRR